MRIPVKICVTAAIILAVGACEPEVTTTEHTVVVAGKTYKVVRETTRSSNYNYEKNTAFVNGDVVPCQSFSSCPNDIAEHLKFKSRLRAGIPDDTDRDISPDIPPDTRGD